MRTSYGLRILAATALTVTLVAAAPSAVSAGERHDSGAAGDTVPSRYALRKPASMPISRQMGRIAAPPPMTKTCTALSDSRSVCVAPTKPSRRPTAAPPQAGPILPLPAWCVDSKGTPVSGSRTEACRIIGLILTTYRFVNGTWTVTGELNIDVWDYTYASVDLPHWNHQISISPWSGWGDAVNSTVTGTLSVTGNCVPDGAPAFPVQSLSPVNKKLRNGTARARTTATAVNAIGSCTTTWNLVLTPAGYSPTPGSSGPMSEVACDNATSVFDKRPRRVGCVVPWFPAQVFYSASRYPSLASHVSRAQASGLPGTGFANPLTRNTDKKTIDLNRRRACGDAPSIPGKSCDEYPLATTRQGLAFGGTRRTFPGCNINAPTGVTGPTGASACMITASENSAQGAVMGLFYYENRVLNTDPFRVGISN